MLQLFQIWSKKGLNMCDYTSEAVKKFIEAVFEMAESKDPFQRRTGLKLLREFFKLKSKH
jgi:hypothetical protein